MKKLTIILQLFALFLLTQGCQEYEMVEYGEGGEINFMGRWWVGSHYYWDDDAKYLSYGENFGMNPKGEALLADTVLVGVKVMGVPADHPRKVSLKANPPKENALEVIFPEEYYVPADTGMAVFKVLVKRPAKRNQVYTTELMFDYAQSDFKAGTLERQVFKLQAEDRASLELWGITQEYWDYEPVMFFGEWSETKMRYMITFCGCTDFNEWYGEEDSFFAIVGGNLLYESLEEYKSDPANPPLLDENTGEWIEFPDLSELLG